VNAAVADLTVNGIIGLDFLTKYNCTVDMRKQEITIGDHNKFQMIKKGQFNFNLGSLNTVSRSVDQEVKVSGKVCVPAGEQYITEPLQRSANDMSTRVGRSPTAGDDTVPVRMLNTTDDPFIIRKGTHMAQNSSVCFMSGVQTGKSQNRLKHA
jgi:hypothetical protein